MLDRRKVSAEEKAQRRKLILADFAQGHQGTLRSKKVGIDTDLISFRCSFGHNFELSLRQIKRDSWCKFCRDGFPLLETCCARQWFANSLSVIVLGSRSPACGVSSTCQVPDSTAPRILVSSNSAAALVAKVVLAFRRSPFGSVNRT
jgi:hypothetical protein